MLPPAELEKLSGGREGLSEDWPPLEEGEREAAARLRFPEAAEAMSAWVGEGVSGGLTSAQVRR